MKLFTNDPKETCEEKRFALDIHVEVFAENAETAWRMVDKGIREVKFPLAYGIKLVQVSTTVLDEDGNVVE